MKAITINVSEPVYARFQEYAKQHDRTTSELIREAMDLYRSTRIEKRSSLRDLGPAASVGEVYHPYSGREDLFEEMIDADRD